MNELAHREYHRGYYDGWKSRGSDRELLRHELAEILQCPSDRESLLEAARAAMTWKSRATYRSAQTAIG